MGYNCCGPEEPDFEDNRIDMMLEHKPSINKRNLRKAKTDGDFDSQLAEFLIPVNKSKMSIKGNR